MLANAASSLLSNTLETTVEEQICSIVDGLVGDDGLGDELLAGINEVLAPLDPTGSSGDVSFLNPLGPENSLTEMETANWLNYQTSE